MTRTRALIHYCRAVLFVLGCTASAFAFDLVDAKGRGVPVVHGVGLEREAAALAGICRAATGTDHAIVAAATVMQPGTWRLGEPWIGRPLILFGNVADNEAMFALYSRYLAGANAAYPGPGRYVLRALAQPFRRGTDIFVVGASDAAGAGTALTRCRELVAPGATRIPATIELGGAGGPDKVRARTSGDFARSATRFYWTGDEAAGNEAKVLLLKRLETDTRGLFGFDHTGHYGWERHYRPLQQLLTTDALTADEKREVDARLLYNALNNTDWAAVAAMRCEPTRIMDRLGRHQLSALAGNLIIFDYLHHIGTVPEDRREAVRKGQERLQAHCRSLIQGGHFHSNILAGTEGSECINILADLYLFHGDRRFVEDGILRRMADYNIAAKDNLGWYAGGDSYITCRPGCHFARASGGAAWLLAGFLYGDGRYRWMLENQHAFLTHFQVARPPETTALLNHLEPMEPTQYYGLTTQPVDAWCYGRCTAPGRPEVTVPVDAPVAQLFSRATFRDRFDRDAAYLLVQGLDTGSINANYSYQANAITRYTELGSLLLFSNSMKHTGWAQNVVSASRGEPDPQSTACVLDAHFSSDLVAGMQSRHERHGGMRWVRLSAKFR